ncbi:PAS domain-containing protein [uncultured Brevundimonas sp.]|uniref:PAS domain-containing protein n=1 Tax=uncultured Brevundimonas sp. TaxID=213418 RepID=UPI0030EBFE21|tara:strand:+ start:63683 stop:68401 length:4719 start_codon:yes stop_codon:yes gene_type:complete
MSDHKAATADNWLTDGGEMAGAIRAHDWSASPLGPLPTWPVSLRAVVNLMITSRYPMFVAWGPALTFIYNDAYAPILGEKHGTALGEPFQGVWSDIWDDINPLVERALAGEATFNEDLHLVMERYGYPEDTWYSFSYSPVRDETGAIAGMFCVCAETTETVLTNHRMGFRIDLDDRLRGLEDATDLLTTACELVGRHLEAGRCGYGEVDPTDEFLVIKHDWTDGRMPPLPGRIRLADYGQELVKEFQAGRAVRLADPLTDNRTQGHEAAFAAIGGVRAGMAVPILKNGRLSALFYVNQTVPRRWNDADEMLLQDVAERLWWSVQNARTQARLRESQAVLNFTLDSAKVGDWDLDLLTDQARRSARHDACFGYAEPVADWGFEQFLAHVDPRDRDDVEKQFREAVTNLTEWRFECRVVWPDGSIHWISADGSIYRTSEGRATRMLGIVSDVTDRKRSEMLQMAQRRVLELAVQDAPLTDTLGELLTTIEEQAQGGMIGSILLLDRDGQHLRHGAGPNLPDEYNRAIDGVAIGQNVGSCGTAAFLKEPVFVSDIADDVRWADFRDLALSHGLRACWSTPILSTNGAVLGTFAMYYREPREPHAGDLELVDVTTRSASLLIERHTAAIALRESEARFKFALDAASAVGTWDWDVKADRVYADPHFARLYSVDPDRAARGAPVAEFTSSIHEADQAQVAAGMEQALAAGEDFQSEYRLVLPGGQVRWVLARGRAYHDSQGEPVRFPGVVLDITDRKQDEAGRQALIDMNDRWRDLRDPSEIAYVAAEVLGQTLGLSRAGYGTIDPGTETVEIQRDWTAPEVKSLAGVRHFRDYGSFINDLKRGETVVFSDTETDPRNASAAKALKAVAARAIVNMPVLESGRLVAMLFLNAAEVREWSSGELALIREVAERTRTTVERARGALELAASEALFRSVAEAMPGFVWSADTAGQLDYTSPRWLDYSGDGGTEGLGEGWAGFVHPDDLAGALERWQSSIQTGDLYEIEFRLRRKDGIYRWWLVRAVPVRDDADAITRWIGSAADIDEIVAAREVLARARDDLERTVEATTAERDRLWTLSRDPFLIADSEGRWLSVSPVWTELLGWSEQELVGRNPAWMEHPDDTSETHEQLDRLASGDPILRYENRFRTRDGDYRWFSWTAVPDGALIYAVARDVTAEKAAAAALQEAESQLRQSQKMEAVGQLTGGIAHDFNNMLAVVMGSLELLDRRLDKEDNRARRYVEAASEGARRAALLTQRLLAFSRQQPLQPVPVDANRLVGGMSDLLRRALGTDIRLETVLAGGVWGVHVDPNQLENVILNLAVNARDAMPDGGHLMIETQNAHLDDRYVAAEIGVAPGQYVLIAVTDSGSGMSSDVIAKAFDPFFTTKEVGKGTGLGLSQVYGFIKQSQGHVRIYSEPGQGTTIKLYLPRLTDTDATTPEEDDTTKLVLGEKHEVVLVVEDEPAVRRFSVEALTELGYGVLEADGAPAALRLLEQHPDISLLFTDVVMPDVNGARLAEAARRLRPDLKVLFTTGYTRNAVVHNGVLDPGVELIGKPFSVEDLSAKVRNILDRVPIGSLSD